MSKATKGEGARQEWRGYTMTSLLRLCGSKGFSKAKARAVMKAMKLIPSDGTIGIQLGRGRKKNADLPEWKGDDKAEFAKLAAGIADEKPTKRKKGKATKGDSISPDEEAAALAGN